jgi:hypothetical protein
LNKTLGGLIYRLGISLALTKCDCRQQWEVMMINRISAALALGLFAASFISPSSAQDMAKRDAAVAKCSAEAQKKVPNQQTADQVASRTAAYSECMKAAGFAP